MEESPHLHSLYTEAQSMGTGAFSGDVALKKGPHSLFEDFFLGNNKRKSHHSILCGFLAYALHAGLCKALRAELSRDSLSPPRSSRELMTPIS